LRGERIIKGFGQVQVSENSVQQILPFLEIVQEFSEILEVVPRRSSPLGVLPHACRPRLDRFKPGLR
jgi:hypothetical protein